MFTMNYELLTTNYFLGVWVNGKPLVSKTRTGGSIPSTPGVRKYADI